MAQQREHKEFYQVDINKGWETIPGYDKRIQRKVLVSSIDYDNKCGGLTRLLRFEPGAYSTEPFIHDHWEEVFVLEGELIVDSDKNGKGGVPYPKNTHCCRPPNIFHGPFRSEHGCLLLESHYYESTAD